MKVAAKKDFLRLESRVPETKKRGRSIASVSAISFTVPFSTGLRGVAHRTSFASVPFDPDIDPILSFSESATPAVVFEPKKKANTDGPKNFHHRVSKTGDQANRNAKGPNAFPKSKIVRASARHVKSPYVVENSPIRGVLFCGKGANLSHPSASYEPAKSNTHHVWPADSTTHVTELRQRSNVAALQQRGPIK